MAIACKVGHDLFGWDRGPVFIEPSVPAVLRVVNVASLDLELGLDRVGDAATEQRLGVDVAVGREMIIRPL